MKIAILTGGGDAPGLNPVIRAVAKVAHENNVEMIGIKTKVKIVKNKVAPPFRFTELEITFGKGISYEGDLIDLGVSLDVVEKSGTWYSYENQRMGQGRESAKQFLIENPTITETIESQIRKKIEDKKANENKDKEKNKETTKLEKSKQKEVIKG